MTSTVDSKAISVALATALLAISEYSNGYISVTLEFGNDIAAEIGACKTNKNGILVSGGRVWTLDEDLNEVPLLEPYIDFDIVEKIVKR